MSKKPKAITAKDSAENMELLKARYELTRVENDLAFLRILCKRILATHDTSAYAKGSEQELWREFKREVEG